MTSTGIAPPQFSSHRQATSEKARLRAEALALRKAVWLKSGAPASQAIAVKGVTVVQSLGLAGPVAGYHALPSELDPLPLLQILHARGFRIALPCMRKGPALTFREWAPGSALRRRKFGVYEPAESQPAIDPAVIFAPLLAFDRKGNRLGYGAGYYDAGLRELRARRRILAIGVAFDEQECAQIPREPQDEPLDMVLTPSRVIHCGE